MLKINKNIETVKIINTKEEFRELYIERYNKNYKFLDLRNLDFDSTIEEMDFQFMGCEAEVIDVTGWNTEHFITTAYMFAKCPNLKRLIGLNTWDVSSVRTMARMFWNCPELEDIGEINNWKFRNDISLESIFKDSPKVKIPKVFVKYIRGTY